ESFIANPFDNGEDYNVLYRTGDMVRILPDGTLGIVGRRDSQVKIRGNRVELSEVEAVIRELDYIEDITVQTIKHDDNYELVAYVVSDGFDEDTLRNNICEYVGEFKPDYMVPSHVINLDRIPLNVNGKVNKRELPEVDFDGLQVEYVAPTTQAEREIVDAFEIAFNRENIGIHDDFIALGGDSLTAIKLVSHLNDYDISVADILSLHTPYAIAKNIKEFSLDLDIYDLDSGCPLNESQLNVYLDILANDKVDAYLIPLVIDISGEYSIDSVVDALEEMFNVHPILGMRINNEFDVPYLVKGSDPSIIVKSSTGEDYIYEFLTQPFDLQNSLCRFLIVEKDDGYKLFAVFHHIIFDALSQTVFKKDLQSILDEEDIDVDYAFIKISAFNKQIQNMPEYVEASEYYESLLCDVDDKGILLDSVLSDGPGVRNINLDLDSDLFKSFIKQYGVSENVLFTSVFAYTLSRFVGSDSVLFNIIENGRDRLGIFDSIGMFVNTLPLFVNCKEQSIDSFMEYLSQSIYSAMKYNYYQFRLLANEYAVDSNIIFQYLPEWTTDIGYSDKDVSENTGKTDIFADMDDFITDFNVNVVQENNDYILNVNYSDKYSSGFVSRFMESYKLILQDMLSVEKLSDINYITAEDIVLLDSYNGTEHSLGYDDILDAFNDNLSDNPDKCLVKYNDLSYTYGEGAFIADKINNSLNDIGVDIGDKVAFLVERSELYMFSVLGILSAGAVYVPLDDAHPDERMEFILNDTESKVLIVSDKTYERVKELASDITILNISDNVKGRIGRLSSLPVNYGDLACILYTSGTTGVPKGVKVTRKSILNLSESYMDSCGFNGDDVYGLFASISFDAASQAICQTVYAGASLSIVPDEIRFDINEMNNYFIRHGVTHTMITTQVGKLFIENIVDTSIRVLTLGGEKLGQVVNSNKYQLIDGFGPTETFAFITSIDNSDKVDYSSIGVLNYNTKAYILDDEFRRTPVGAVGELYLAGYQIADGYLNREDETNRAFMNNPFNDNNSYNVLYRTGDMVRLLPDGSLAIVGRRDSQVKIRGNRVELSEVESIIRELDYVDDVTVQTVKNDANNELVAYVVTSKDMDEDALKEDICNYVIKYKPDYMLPSYVVKLEEIPLNINGKVDKRTLPKVDFNLLQAEYVPPTTQAEKEIVYAFESVFNQENIGIYDDFVRLGGDSLTAIKLISHLKNYNITVADILSLHTPKAIAENIKENDYNLDIYSLESGCPLNESQLNVYLDIIANDKFNAYLIPLFTKISKDYAINELFEALNKMMDIHPILNMCIDDDFDVPHLVKGKMADIYVKSEIDEESINEFLTKGFNLHESLCKFLIVENDDDYDLFAVFHHLIFDGLSNIVFKNDLLTILDGGSLEEDVSFLKISAFNNEIQKREEYDDAKEFYNMMLSDSDDAGSLLDCVLNNGPGISKIKLDFNEYEFDKFLKDNNISENVLFTSVFAYTLSRFVGSDNALFNMIENGRDRFNNFNSIGMYVNTLPLLVDCKNEKIPKFMDYISDLIYKVMRYNYYPFRVLAKEYGIDSNILFQFMPRWVNGDIKNVDDDDLKLSEMVQKESNLNTEFSVNVIQTSDGYDLSVTYSDKYSSDFVKRFINSYMLVLQEIIHVDSLSDINYISDVDTEILDRYNQTEHDLEYADVLDAFNDNLRKNPDNMLVSYNSVSYTYGECAYIADKIAQKLVDLGVKPQDHVGFLVPRSELYILNILGILSMGGIYVPLDYAHPDAHIRYIIEDTQSKVIICSNDTYERAKDLTDNVHLLNISDIINDEIGSLFTLPVIYGDLACILYTSGTTGNPKGVKITRKSLLNVSTFYTDKYDLTDNDVYALFSAIGFDVSNFIICVVLYAGSCLSIIPEDIRLNMVEMNNYFIEHGVNHAFITTQVGKLFMQSIEDTSLDVLLVAGEKLGKVESPQNYELIDGFGPTESFAFISSVHNSDKITESSVGYLNYNTKAYVLDNEKRRVPVGAVGELCLAGIQIADGYLNREEETKESFIANPFDNGEDYNVLYRTGDMVRILPDGTLGIVGRRDSQVKIRGNRVELSEIESVIREMDYIDDVTVQTFENKNNNEIVAYVVVSDEFDSDELRMDIRDYVAKSKPDYMLPAYVVVLDSIQLTVNGKVDTRALPEVDVGPLSVEYVAPTNETEKHIIESFEVVFNQKGLGLFDDFVRLGGDSIGAIRVVSLLEKNGVYCKARDILNYKTPYLISQHIDLNVESQSYDAVEGAVDLLPIQDYFFEHINLDTYIQPFILKFKADLDVDILQKSIDELTNLHDMLRAVYTFKEDENKSVQEILPLNTRICEIKEYTFDDNFDENIRNVFIESSTSLNIENKLMDINLVHYDDNHYLIIIIHHLIIDGVSWNILLTDLTHIYYNLHKGEKIDIPRPYPYKSWVEDVRNLVENISDEEKQHWIEVNSLLDDSLIKGNTKVFAFNVESSFDVNNLLMLTEEEYLALAISRAYKKTYNMDIIFNRESYGRDDNIANINRTIGWFTSQYPVHIKIDNKYDDISLMKDVYSLKKAFNDINHLGLNYASLIYTTNDLKFKHCPVTFNFLSNEFVFKNEFLESVNHYLSENNELNLQFESESYGITFNVSRIDNTYLINGDYAMDTYIGNKFNEFKTNIEYELEFISNYKFSEGIVCCLNESQLGVYLDEKVNDKGTAYSVPNIIKCGDNHSVDDIEDAIHALIDKHPILKARVLDTDELPLLVCDACPEIEFYDIEDYSQFIRPFDLDKSLVRFFIVDNGDAKFIGYDMHHLICDANSAGIINRDLNLALNANLDKNVDLGFVYDSRDSFESKFKSEYNIAKEFFNDLFGDISDVRYLLDDIDGSDGAVSLPIRGIRSDVDSFVHNQGITVGNFLNAIFAYTYSRFVGSDKVYFTYTEHGRHKDYNQDAMGMFVRTIPIIVDCKNKSVKEYMNDVSDLILKSMSNSIYPFRLLASEFNINNNVLFEYNYDLNDVSKIGNDVIYKDYAEGICEFSCIINDLDDGFLVNLDHNGKYSQNTAERFVNVFKKVLIGFLNNEHLSDVNHISDEDILLLDSYNQTEHGLVYDDVLDAFNDNLAKCPKNNLVFMNNNHYSYGEGAYIADRIAKQLMELGVKAGGCVGFLTGRCEYYMFSILGILSVGAV
uniref:amino acid adenylation domain-containing protein n=1 Tax=Methanobrevibacter sp. TaxID=66852 RepID=UPI00388EE4B4